MSALRHDPYRRIPPQLFSSGDPADELITMSAQLFRDVIARLDAQREHERDLARMADDGCPNA